MKKTRLFGAALTAVLAVTGAPALPGISAPFAVTASAASKLAAPKNISASVTDTTIKLSWNKVTGADAYRVYKLNSSTGKYETYKNVSGTTCNVKKLTAGTAYKFRVAALVKTSTGYAVQTKSAAASVKTKLAAPGNVKASVSGSSVTITWNKVTGADKYRVYTYDSASESYKTYKEVTGTSVTVKGLSSGTYKFKVAALVKSGSKYTAQVQSAEVSAKIAGTSSSSGVPITFPSFGTSMSNAKKQMGLSYYTELGEYQKGIYASGGFANINGEDCVVLMYFDSNDEFFYGVAVIPNTAVKASKLISGVKSVYGDPDIDTAMSGLGLTEWVLKNDTLVAVMSVSDAEASIYLVMDRNRAPDSLGADGDLSSSIDSVLELLNS